MPEDRATTVETAKGQTLTFTHLSGFDEVSRCFEFTVGLTGPELDVEAGRARQPAAGDRGRVERSQALVPRAGERVPARQGRGAGRELRGGAAPLAVAARADLRLPHLPEPQRGRDRREGLRQVSRGRVREAAAEELLPAGILRAVRRKRPRLRAAPARARGNLLFLRVRRERPHPRPGRLDRQAEAGRGLRGGAVPHRGQPGAPRPRLPLAMAGHERAAPGGLRAHGLQLREAEPVAPRPSPRPTPVPKLFRGESYRQPGAHQDVSLGDAVAAIRREELQAPHVRVLAGGTARGLASGCTFKLDGHPRDEPERRAPGAAGRLPPGRSRAPRRPRGRGGELPRRAGRRPDRAALPSAAHDARTR